MIRPCGDDGRWQGRPASTTDINTLLGISLLIDRYDSRRVAGQLVDDRNVIICGAGMDATAPFHHYRSGTLRPPSTHFTSWPWQILPPARLSEPAVNRDWDPLVGAWLAHPKRMWPFALGADTAATEAAIAIMRREIAAGRSHKSLWLGRHTYISRDRKGLRLAFCASLPFVCVTI